MKAVNNKIIVQVDPSQKDQIQIGDLLFQSGIKYEINYREKSPVIATVIEGNDKLNKGDVILCHHNSFYIPSPYHLYDDFFSIPANVTIVLIKILQDGTLMPLYGNMICNEIVEQSLIELPPELIKMHKNRYEVVDGGWSIYKKGDIVFTRPSSGYTIVWNVNGKEHRTVRVNSEMVCGVIKIS